MRKHDLLALSLLAMMILVLPTPGLAVQKYIPLEDMGQRRTLEVSADGKRIYLSSSDFLVLDESGLGGHFALCRPDGTEAKKLVTKGDMGSMAASLM